MARGLFVRFMSNAVFRHGFGWISMAPADIFEVYCESYHWSLSFIGDMCMNLFADSVRFKTVKKTAAVVRSPREEVHG